MDLWSSLSEVDRHCLFLGKLVANFQSLEWILRTFLVNKDMALGVSFEESHRIWELTLGEQISENAFTNYDSLKKCIRKYNSSLQAEWAKFQVDETLADVRDAIAHGRVASLTESSPMQLLKFSRAKDSRVTVKFSVNMTEEWLKEQMGRVYREFLKVHEATNLLWNERG
jgi:hypothetical protein